MISRFFWCFQYGRKKSNPQLSHLETALSKCSKGSHLRYRPLMLSMSILFLKLEKLVLILKRSGITSSEWSWSTSARSFKQIRRLGKTRIFCQGKRAGIRNHQPLLHRNRKDEVSYKTPNKNPIRKYYTATQSRPLIFSSLSQSEGSINVLKESS